MVKKHTLVMGQQRIWAAVLTLALALTLLPVVRPAYAATITVDTTSDVLDAASGDCGAVTVASLPGPDGHISLREAMCAANNNAGSDTIAFDISCGGGACTIQPSSALPTMSGGGTIINGYTQPGAVLATATTSATLKIEIDGINVTDNNGFTIVSAGNIIGGVVINRFGWDGIRIAGSGATGNVIVGNHIGTDVAGTADRGNGSGVYISEGARNNIVGGNIAAERNVISGNDEYGVEIYGSNAMSNTVSGNYIGTDAGGVADLGNTLNGVHIYLAAQNNTVGGDAAGERNIISGNNGGGVYIEGGGTTGNTVSGNYIGTDKDGTADLGNSCDGVTIGSGAQNNTVGGDTAGGVNLISGNNQQGVRIFGSGTTGNTVSGNIIGTNKNGTASLGNTMGGISIYGGAQHNIIGGDAPGKGNLISGNNRHGVEIEGSGTMNNTVSGNYIGATITGAADLGNGGSGVSIGSGAQNSTVGGDVEGGRNIISGNDEYGVCIFGSGTMSNTVSGNYIGTDKNGTAALGNTLGGIYIYGGAQNNTVGGDTAAKRNVISGNNRGGIYIQHSGTMSNAVSGNYIGPDKNGTANLGNSGSGVAINVGAQNNIVGGDTPGERNVISGNDEYGVLIGSSGTMSNTVSGNYIGVTVNGTAALGNTWTGVYIGADARNNMVGPGNLIAHNGGDGVEVSGSSAIGNTIIQNSIYANVMGINLDSGANGSIKSPVIVTTTAGSVNVVGTACPGCTVQVFANSDTDGEGETYVGSVTATASGAFTVTVSFLGKPYLTATATRAISGTSEFSAVFTSTVTGGKVYLPLVLRESS